MKFVSAVTVGTTYPTHPSTAAANDEEETYIIWLQHRDQQCNHDSRFQQMPGGVILRWRGAWNVMLCSETAGVAGEDRAPAGLSLDLLL